MARNSACCCRASREEDAFAVAEGVRQKVAAIVATLPNPVTVSAGVASFPAHALRRDELFARRGRRALRLQAGREEPHQYRGRQGPARADVLGPAEVGLDLLHSKDADTLSHSIHVAILAVEIARALALDDARLDDLRTAARLHDIGKIAVPDAILQKRGSLDDEEFRLIKTHSVVGAELLEAWGLPAAATIVRQHHERIDGSGYPAGLAGDEICIESRIVHAADAYVAMIRDRPYRKAMTQDEAFAELVRHTGTQFDADVVAALIALERARPVTIGTPADERRSELTPSGGRALSA